MHFGAVRWIRRAQILLLLLCIFALSISPAPWSWQLSTLACLAAVYLLIRRSVASSVNSGTVRIFQDDTAMLSTGAEKRVFATLTSHHWVSPWFSSVTVRLARGGRRRFLIICRSNNDADEYRRMLRFLRIRQQASETQRMIW